MQHVKIFSRLCLLFLFFTACVTDPIVPPGGIPPGAAQPGVPDPGPENPCAAGEISFQHQVMPIMLSACAFSGCHDAITAEDDVILNSYASVRKEVLPGDPGDSELYESITETDPDDIMPPPPAEKLTAEQIKVIRDWINQGAKNTDCGVPCDPLASSFVMDIYPIMQDYCVGCHNDNRMDGNVNLISYEKLKPYAENGSLLGTIRAEVLYPVMPPSGNSLSACRIAQIQKWIDEGMQNN